MADLKIVTSTGRVKLDEGFVLPRRVRVKVAGEATDEHLPFAGEAELRYQGGRMEVTSLALRQVEGGPPVTGEILRAIPRALVREVVRRLMQVDLLSGRRTPPAAMLATPRPRDMAARGLSDEALMLTASIYRRAYVVGDAPARAVHEILGIPRSTAGRWIMLARQRGFLGPTEERKAGEEV